MSHSQEIDMERLILIAGGHTAFQLLWAGIQLGVFDQLATKPGLNGEQLTENIKLEEYPGRILLTGLTALGLIKKTEEGYFNASLTNQMLVPGKPGYAAPILGWQAHIVYPGLMHFIESLQQSRNVGLEKFPGEGNTLYERLVSHPHLEKIFQDAMSALSQQANAHLIQAYDFNAFSHIVDAGGGDGTNAITLANSFSNLNVTVFDSPSVCEIARKKINAAGLSDRVSVWPGNFLTDPFPPNIDAVLYCHILTIWSMEHNLQLIRKTHAALPSGGAVLIFNMMGDDDETGPLSTALGSPYFLAIATGEGMLHSWKDYETVLHQAGFAHLQRFADFSLSHGLIVAKK
ncbi:MAG: methyltransferase [Methylohalobius sp. ZOD2]